MSASKTKMLFSPVLPPKLGDRYTFSFFSSGQYLIFEGGKVNDQEGVLQRGSGKGSIFEKVKIGEKKSSRVMIMSQRSNQRGNDEQNGGLAWGREGRQGQG